MLLYLFIILIFLMVSIPVATAQTAPDTLMRESPQICCVQMPNILPLIDSIPSIRMDNTAVKYKKKFTYESTGGLTLYDFPYNTKLSIPDHRRLITNASVFLAAGFATLGVLQALPEDATAWNSEEINSTPMFKRWGNNVSNGPVWDGDNPIFNYILHPYAGAVYYMAGRSAGLNCLGSFLYCFGISTVFWEYGIEAFMEKPSIQDLIITPMAGLIVGETFYKLKRRIVNDGYTLWGSSLCGNIVAFVIDPFNEVIGLFTGNPCRQKVNATKSNAPVVASTPWIVPTQQGAAYGLTVSIAL